MFYFFKRRQYLSLASPYSNCMFKVSGWFPIASTDTPTVGHKPYFSITHSNHGFYSYTHAFFKHDAIATPSIVGYLRILVHLLANAMSGEFSHHTISMGFTKSLDCITDISDMISCHCHFNTFCQ